jgi:hypothetical protein
MYLLLHSHEQHWYGAGRRSGEFFHLLAREFTSDRCEHLAFTDTLISTSIFPADSQRKTYDSGYPS